MTRQYWLSSAFLLVSLFTTGYAQQHHESESFTLYYEHEIKRLDSPEQYVYIPTELSKSIQQLSSLLPEYPWSPAFKTFCHLLTLNKNVALTSEILTIINECSAAL